MTGQFQVGGTLRKDKFYIKRDADEFLYQAILENEFCYVLSSRQIGKSSLMARTAIRLKEEDYLVAFLDITGTGDTDGDAAKFYNYVFKKICRGAKVPFDQSILDYEKETIGQNFETLIDYVLSKTTQKICVFIDEIDKIIDLSADHFDTDAFFSFLRYIKNKTATKPIYERINFVVLGVATPSDLIKNKERTPFNIGTKIELKNFTFEEAKLLIPGLEPHFEDAENLLQKIITWTGGQPYLTQRFCKLIIDYKEHENDDIDTYLDWVASKFFINEAETEPNLSNIRDRILKNDEHNFEMLLLLKKITSGEAVKYDSKNKAQEYLKLTGLVNNKGQKLDFTNRIYKEVFTKDWVEDKFNFARFPFKKELLKWENNERKDKFLLKGILLDDAVEWQIKTNEISKTEKEFIEGSRAYRDKIRERERKARWIYFGLLGLGALVFFFMFMQANTSKNTAEKKLASIDKRIKIINKQFETVQNELNDLKSERDDAQQGIDSLRTSIGNEADTLQNERAQLIEELNKYIGLFEERESEIKDLNSDLNRLNAIHDKQAYTIATLEKNNDQLTNELRRYKAGNVSFLEVEKGKTYIISKAKSAFSRIVLRQGASLVIDDKLNSAEITAQEIVFYDKTKIDGSGSDGANGKTGLSGANGKDCQPGQNGQKGGNGSAGKNGKSLSLKVERFTPKGNGKLLINVSGGDGGNGGKGGHGGFGGKSDCSSNCDGGNGGNGGDTGLGGSGGKRGKLSGVSERNRIEIVAKDGTSGKEGIPGKGGVGGVGKKCVFYTKNSGRPGRSGVSSNKRKLK